MGVTVKSKNYSIDMGYNGFNMLRTKIAELTGPEIHEHYKKLNDGIYLYGQPQKEFFEEYNKAINELEKSKNIPHGILDFLYKSDCGGKLPFTKCKQIYEVIKDYDDNIAYGYVGRSDCAVFSDFKKLIKDCADNKCRMEWF